MISFFKNVKSPKIIGEIDVYEFIESIKKPKKDVFKLILEARKCYKNNKYRYDYIKTILPCFTLNFNFRHKKSNENIKSPTGLIYLDLDDEKEIDLNNRYIFASWLSLSNNGRGILVKVENLNLENFKETYVAIAKELNLRLDMHAGKATQYNVHSFDEYLYLNEDSLTWIVDNSVIENSTPISPLKRKKKKDNSVLGGKQKIRFNNFDEFDFNGRKYVFFKEEKKLMASIVVPKNIVAGRRNSIVYAIAYQLKGLNPQISYSYLKKYIDSINIYHCKPTLKNDEITTIVKNVISAKSVKLTLNSPRRFLFNPEAKLTFKQKMKIVNPLTGKVRTDKTISEIKEHIIFWDVIKNGKVTQRALTRVTGKNKKTIEKYYKLFKNEIKIINNELNSIQLAN
ncbi:hypothetical protein [Polaribacter sp. Asnod1-A03]|uniref:hypothetical protein n=1 Tax=Polaribacter sp. Asnod1-A03 TaxID=3160581 RepID=UPI00386C65C4